MTGLKRWVRLGGVLTAVLVLYFTVPVSYEVKSDDLVSIVVSILALVLLTVLVLLEVRHQLVEDDRRLDALVIALMIAVLAFALGFYILAERRPDQIADLETRVDALYFTMATLLTIGYGDVHATGQAARVLVLIQMVFNVVVLATAASVISTRIRTRAEQRVEARRSAEDDDSLPPPRRHGRRTHRNPT